MNAKTAASAPASNKVKVVFTHTPSPRQGGNFEAGDVVAMSKESADRWIRRGVAMTETDYKEMKAAEKAEAKAKAEGEAADK